MRGITKGKIWEKYLDSHLRAAQGIPIFIFLPRRGSRFRLSPKSRPRPGTMWKSRPGMIITQDHHA